MIDKNITPGEYTIMGQHKNCECGYGLIMKVTPSIIDDVQHPINAPPVIYKCSGRIFDSTKGCFIWCSYSSKKINKGDIT